VEIDENTNFIKPNWVKVSFQYQLNQPKLNPNKYSLNQSFPIMNPKYSVDSELETKLPKISKRRPVFKKINLSHFIFHANISENSKSFKSSLDQVKIDFPSPANNNPSPCMSPTCKLLDKYLKSRSSGSPSISQCMRRLFKDHN
jgi:hypothetical protein